MSVTYNSLTHSKWDCKYHVILVPKNRRKALFGEICKDLGPISYESARQKECCAELQRINFTVVVLWLDYTRRSNDESK
jgi:REP element-mobilizing transposase RayT